MSSALKKLLNEWKLENILPHLIAEEIDVDILEMMKASHIHALLANFPMGIQIRFEHSLEKWRNKIGKPIKFHLYDGRNSINIRKSLEKDILNSNHEAQNSKHSINLKQILSQCKPDGLELIDIYRKNQNFSTPERSHLINIIINYYLEQNLPFNLQISYDLENAILSLFPNERLDMYRTTKEGKIYTKFLTAKGVYQQKLNENNDKDNVEDDDDHAFQNDNRNHEHSRTTYTVEDLTANSNTSSSDIPNEILLQTLYKSGKQFIKILKPFSLKDFLATACSTFDIINKSNIYVAVNECEIAESDFENVILQYYKLSSFVIEIKKKATQITKLEHFEDSCSPLSSFTQSSNYFPQSSFINAMDNSTIQIINTRLPDANDIRNIPSLLPIVKMSDDGKPLENKHRTAIAKAIIDECLSFQPDRVLKRQDFFTLTENLIRAFPNEVASAYFIPSQPNHAARGKLWNAYNNKRSFLGSSGIVQRRHNRVNKRKHQSDQDEDSEKTNDNVYVVPDSLENVDFNLDSSYSIETLKEKWSNCHRARRNELEKQKLTPQQYMQKYSILKSNRGIDLVEIDVNILYPTVANVSNWLSLYAKVIEMARKMRKIEAIPKILESIDTSFDERYCASLSLLLVPYIFPYNARRNETNGERATKCEIQERFIKEYTTVDDLKSDFTCAELQIRFVHQGGKISYAEFNICGHVFKCVDLLEALSSIFHYVMALNVEYPKMCLHIWQFIQLAIFQIEIQGCIQPNVQSFINDLYMT